MNNHAELSKWRQQAQYETEVAQAAMERVKELEAERDALREAIAGLRKERGALREALKLFLAHSPEPECAIWRHIHSVARAALAQEQEES